MPLILEEHQQVVVTGGKVLAKIKDVVKKVDPREREVKEIVKRIADLYEAKLKEFTKAYEKGSLAKRHEILFKDAKKFGEEMKANYGSGKHPKFSSNQRESLDEALESWQKRMIFNLKNI